MTRRAIITVVFGAAAIGTLCAQRPFREFPGVEYRLGSIPLPVDWQERTEFVFARLMYPSAPGGRNGYGRGFGRGYGGVWTEGNTIWTQDYPRADRHFLQAVRRLTRIHRAPSSSRQPGRGRRVRLAVAVCRATGPLAT